MIGGADYCWTCMRCMCTAVMLACFLASTSCRSQDVLSRTWDVDEEEDHSWTPYGVRMCPDRGTTPFFHEIFLGRCYDHQVANVHATGTSCDLRNIKNCSELWKKFSAGFMFRQACNETEEAFEDFIDAAAMPIPKDMSMFWSGTYEIVHAASMSGRKYTTLEDWLPGYLVNNISWCGQEQEPGYVTGKCPRCPGNYYSPFWHAASKRFASTASGMVTVMLNGSTPTRPALRNDSIFATEELPSLDVRRVNKVRALVIHNLEGPIAEKCGEKSLALLDTLVRQRGLKFECVDDPSSVRLFLCAGNPTSPQCVLPSAASRLSCWGNTALQYIPPAALNTALLATSLLQILQNAVN